MSTKKVVFGVLAGIAVGALLGVLFAPDKGSETRKKVAKKGSDTIDDLKNKFDELIKDLVAKCENAEDEIKKDMKNQIG